MKLLKTLWNLPETLSSDKVIKWFSVVVIAFLLTHIVIAIIR